MTDSLLRLRESLADRYRIEHELGAGGMATVYLAHDVRHDRKVALKVLRPELAAILGGERFLKEIRTTANLQHPHILSLFDSGEADGLVFYVMPYVEGESLRERLQREHQLPVDEAVRITREVASALDYAHRHGVVHRDIKPENILLHDGQAFVADFGIALAASRSEGSTRMTETGMSLGTPHYMSPEQAMGEREITPKADVYALGCVLYEMLTGEPPFTGPTAQAIVARVMTEEPRSITLQRRTVPPNVEAATLTALAKLPADRFASAAQFAEALGNATFAGSSAMRATAVTRAGRGASPRRIGWIGMAAAAVVLLGLGLLAGRMLRRAPEVIALQVIPGPDHRLGGSNASNLAVSPDGQTIAYIGHDADERRIHIRRLASFEGSPVAGTQGVFANPTFSPDGKALAFAHEDGTIRRVALGGGQATTLATAVTCCVLQWTEQGITFSTARGLELVSPAGGAPRLVAAIGFPAVAVVLPGGRAAVFLNLHGSRRLELIDLETSKITPLEGLPEGALDVDYSDGHLLLQVGNDLLAVPFDARRRRATGGPEPLVHNVRFGSTGGFRESQSAVGGATLAFVPASGMNRIVFVDRAGRETVVPDTTGTFHRPRFAPDGRRISMDISRPEGRDVWVYDPDQRTLARITFQPNGHDAIWAPDGRSLLYAAVSSSDTVTGMYARRVDGSAEIDTIAAVPWLDAPEAVLADGSVLAYAASPSTRTDAWVVSHGGRHRVLLGETFDESGLALSPDGHWLAYASDESGRREVYVRPFAGGARLQVSTGGAREPRWAPDGRQLYYRSQGSASARLIAARLSLNPLRVQARDTLFSVADYEESDPHANYDISPRGDRFVFIRQQMPNEIRVIRNWQALLAGK
jgi:eukaryotic-like serine/threonine-protein kinase